MFEHVRQRLVLEINIIISSQVLSRSKEWKILTKSTISQLLHQCFKSRAPTTITKYKKEVQLFLQYLKTNNLPVAIPAMAEHVAQYLSFLLGKNKVCVVSNAFYALKWVHDLLPTSTNPLNVGLCKNLMETERRQRTTPVSKKQPVSSNLVRDIVEKYTKQNATLKDLRIATMSLICFTGLFRSKELLDIKVGHLTFERDYVAVHVPSSKTDIYRKGQEVFISSSNNEFCPYGLLLRYIQHANIKIEKDSTDYLFRNVVYLKKKDQYILGKKPLSYTRFRELFKDCLKQLGYDERLYSLHSFRAGGATEVVNNFPDIKSRERLLKLHGRWRTDFAKDMYIEENIQTRLAVSKSLALCKDK